MRGFITDYLPSDPSDWECIEDFCGSMTFVGFHLDLNCCAYYSPSLNKTIFAAAGLNLSKRLTMMSLVI